MTVNARPARLEDCTTIGPVGRIARLLVGVGFVGLALFWRTPHWPDFALGLIGFPLVSIGLLRWRARRHPAPLRAIGLAGHAANVIVLAPLLLWSATTGATFVFYGTAMLVAAARRTGGCEVTAIANAVNRRDDQIGCVFFAPIDLAEAATTRQRNREELVQRSRVRSV